MSGGSDAEAVFLRRGSRFDEGDFIFASQFLLSGPDLNGVVTSGFRNEFQKLLTVTTKRIVGVYQPFLLPIQRSNKNINPSLVNHYAGEHSRFQSERVEVRLAALESADYRFIKLKDRN